MDELRDFFGEILNQELLQIVASNTRDPERASKAKIRPVMIKGQLVFQETLYKGTQVFHGNCTKEEMLERPRGGHCADREKGFSLLEAQTQTRRGCLRGSEGACEYVPRPFQTIYPAGGPSGGLSGGAGGADAGGQGL